METLPEEMVLEVIQHLTDQELAACCAVSRAWRDVFNSDVFWRQRCDMALADHLRDTECVVEPGFKSPEVEGSGLNPVCEGRLSCMRQVHLHNNWALRRCQTFDLPYEVEFVQYIFQDSVAVCLVRVKKLYKIQLWSIKGDPILLSEYPEEMPWEMAAYKNSIFSFDHNLVKVFTILELQLKFSYAFFITGSEKLTSIEEFVDKDPNSEFKCSLIGSLLLAIQKKPEYGSQLHVWNVETGVKLNVETYQDCRFIELYGKNSTKLAIYVLCPTGCAKMVIYDVSRLQFTDFSFDAPEFIPKDVLVYNDYFVVSGNNCLEIYSLVNSQLVEKVTARQFGPGCALGEHFVFNDKFTLKMIDLKSLKVQILDELVNTHDPIPGGFRGKFICYHTFHSTYFINVEKCNSLNAVKPYPGFPNISNMNNFGTIFISTEDINNDTTTFIMLNTDFNKKIVHYW